MTGTADMGFRAPGPGRLLLLALGALAAASLGPALPPAAAAAVSADEYGKVVRENLDLRSRLNEAGAAGEALKRENAALTLRVADLQGRIETLTLALRTARPPEDVQAELLRLRAEKEALERELRARQLEARGPAPGAAPLPGSDLFRKLEDDKAALVREVDRLNAALQEKVRQHEAAEAEAARLRQEAAALAADNEALRADLAAAEAARDRNRRLVLEVARKAQGFQREAAELREKLKAAADRGRPAAPAREAAVEPAPSAPSRDRVFAAGSALLQAGRAADAEKLFLSLVESDPSDAAAHFNLGVIYDESLNQPKKAVAHYGRYLELNPDAADAAAVRIWIAELKMRL